MTDTLARLFSNKTRIVCTIGPASNSVEVMEQLLEAGMNVARLNFSHGEFSGHGQVIENLRAASRSSGHRVAIMADLPGPKIRIGKLVEEPIELNDGDTLVLTTDEITGSRERISVHFALFPEVVEAGTAIYVNDGFIQLEVVAVRGQDVECRVVVGGELRSRKGINLPGVDLGISAFTEHDCRCLEFALQHGVDAVSQSFVECAADIHAVRKAAAALGYDPMVIAKIERAGALENIDEILVAADGIMIARGDLGVEIPVEEMAVVQKQLMNQAVRAGKPVITATHMLESMIIHPTPTRAEVTDITQAVLQGADCTMLSGETTTGKYPVKALEVMDQVARRTEQRLKLDPKVRVEASDDSKYEICRSAAILNNNLQAKATLVFTRRGLMAVLLSRCRPNEPIYAFTNTSHVRRRLAIHWGVQAFIVKFSKAPETTISRAIKLLTEKNIVAAGDRVIVVSDILADGKFVETVQVRII